MGEIKVGEYVRTKEGIIDKVIIDYKGKCNDLNCSEKHISCETNYYCEKDVVKHSPNIIDLIEVGDYVNGKQIIKILNLKVHDIETKLCIYDEKTLEKGLYRGAFKENDIKSIVTKEQFNQVKYEV